MMIRKTTVHRPEIVSLCVNCGKVHHSLAALKAWNMGCRRCGSFHVTRPMTFSRPA